MHGMDNAAALCEMMDLFFQFHNQLPLVADQVFADRESF